MISFDFCFLCPCFKIPSTLPCGTVGQSRKARRANGQRDQRAEKLESSVLHWLPTSQAARRLGPYRGRMVLRGVSLAFFLNSSGSALHRDIPRGIRRPTVWALHYKRFFEHAICCTWVLIAPGWGVAGHRNDVFLVSPDETFRMNSVPSKSDP